MNIFTLARRLPVVGKVSVVEAAVAIDDEENDR